MTCDVMWPVTELFLFLFFFSSFHCIWTWTVRTFGNSDFISQNTPGIKKKEETPSVVEWWGTDGAVKELGTATAPPWGLRLSTSEGGGQTCWDIRSSPSFSDTALRSAQKGNYSRNHVSDHNHRAWVTAERRSVRVLHWCWEKLWKKPNREGDVLVPVQDGLWFLDKVLCGVGFVASVSWSRQHSSVTVVYLEIPPAEPPDGRERLPPLVQAAHHRRLQWVQVWGGGSSIRSGLNVEMLTLLLLLHHTSPLSPSPSSLSLTPLLRCWEEQPPPTVCRQLILWLVKTNDTHTLVKLFKLVSYTLSWTQANTSRRCHQT